MKATTFTILIALLFSVSLKSQAIYKTPSGKEYHLATCSLVRKSSKKITIAKAKQLGLQPCKICYPVNTNNSGNSTSELQAETDIITPLLLAIFTFALVLLLLNARRTKADEQHEPVVEYMSRREYYNEVYLKSDEWKRKRFVVLRRDNWTCVYCGSKATQVHHKRYAKYNIGKEPIDWLVSVCKSCHDAQHR